VIIIKILVTIGHPGHVHFYKNFIWRMQKREHNLKIVVSKKDVNLNLLDAYGFEYDQIFSQKNIGIARLKDQLAYEYKLMKMTRPFHPDIITGIGGTAASHVSKILGCSSIIFTDTENAKLANLITFPFSDVVCTPSCYKNEIGNKQVRYNGYHELAYLHSNYFTPNPHVLHELGLSENEPYVVVRFVSWGAAHDIRQHGIQNKLMAVKKLENFGRVFITSEAELGSEFEKYMIKVAPEKLHDLLYYATLYVGEGGTTASEAAILGTPSIHISSLAEGIGNFIELEKTYDMLFSFREESLALDKAFDILRNPESKKKWRLKRKRLLEDKIDVTAFMIRFIENYPQKLLR